MAGFRVTSRGITELSKLSVAQLPSTVVSASSGSSLPEGSGAGFFKNAEPQWYGPWWTLGNAAGSNGGARTPASAPATTVGAGGVTLPLTNGTVPITDCSALGASGGSFTLGGFTIVYAGRSASSGAGNATGCYTLAAASGTYASGTALGFVGIGWGPLALYQKFGDSTGGSNRPVPGTTQAGYAIASYWGPTVDDSMEGFSALAVAKDTSGIGGTGFTQAQQITGLEGDAQVEGANVASYNVSGIAGRISALGTSHLSGKTQAVYAGLCTRAAGATIDDYAAFRQLVAGAGTVNWGLDVVDPVRSASYLTGTDLQLSNASASVPDPLARALGLQSWNLNPALAATATAPTAGTIYAVAIPLQRGQAITNLLWNVLTGGAGTAPTHIYVGLADGTGTLLAQSADLAANAIWTGVQIAQAPLSAAYTITTPGMYYAVILQVGSWGTTQMTLGRATGISSLPNGRHPQATGGTAQTALPANGSSFAPSATSALNYFAGAN